MLADETYLRRGYFGEEPDETYFRGDYSGGEPL